MQTNPSQPQHDKRARSGWGTWTAERVSDVFSPPVLSGGLAVLLTRLATPTWGDALSWSSLYVVVADLLPLAYLVRLLRRGAVSDLHVGVRMERVRPLIAMLACMGLALFAAMLFSAPHTLRVFLGLSLAQGVVLTIVTLVWQISFHAAAATSLVAASGVIYGVTVALVLAPILLVVAWARLHLKRHTLPQIVAGTAVAATLFGPILAHTIS